MCVRETLAAAAATLLVARNELTRSNFRVGLGSELSAAGGLPSPRAAPPTRCISADTRLDVQKGQRKDETSYRNCSDAFVRQYLK